MLTKKNIFKTQFSKLIKCDSMEYSILISQSDCSENGLKGTLWYFNITVMLLHCLTYC